ncbi:uncharacterized protein NEMAJ01_2250 [Nematocida major]|uniref:uncharacterized protein n=1 Tax=Nematocida major TaxID=1912982 RepID=UPI002007B536|nr:uncharacterized protein NEMAJ01_2250 [Nematocida major]KAH9387354.1 hypothetical protein NEMAJ01_2250 [Nematocida major]
MGNKKKKLLEKYLEKKERQKERDTLVEKLKTLQKLSSEAKSHSLISSSQITRKKAPVKSRALPNPPEKLPQRIPLPAYRPLGSAEFSSLVQRVSTEELCDGIVWTRPEKRRIPDAEITAAEKKLQKTPPEVPLIKTDKALSRTRTVENPLPITHMEDEIVSSVKNHRITVITGGTGTGKSTQVPQFLYENGLAEKKKICITQPRRVSAQAIARRVSEEQKEEVGGVCGYRMRYDSRSSSTTKILVVTEGVLLQELSDDPFLSEYSVVVLDEVHERSLCQDTILLVLAKLVGKTQIRVVLMSASITEEYIACLEAISGSSVSRIEVDAQVYPVEMHYLPLREYDYLQEMKKRVGQLQESPGSILAFVSTKEETERVKSDLQGGRKSVFSLHSETPEEEQREILRSTDAVIIATNVAETSLTLPDVKYVIDGGREIRKRFDYGRGSYTFETVLVSRESADQRRGRTGRVGPGVCYRLYTTVEFENMQETREPEIARERVQGMVTALLKAGVRPHRMERVKFITSPSRRALQEELSELRRLGVVTAEDVTAFGRRVLSLPVDPVLGSALLRARGKSLECFQVMLGVAVFLETYSPRRVQYVPESVGGTKTYIEVLSRPSPPCGNRRKLARHVMRAVDRVLSESLEKNFKPEKPLENDLKPEKIEGERERDVERTVDVALSRSARNTDPEAAVACGKILAWCLSSNIVTAYNGKFYHRGEEVRLRSLLPDIRAERPVPVVYYSLVRPDAEDPSKVSLLGAVVPEYAETPEDPE